MQRLTSVALATLLVVGGIAGFATASVAATSVDDAVTESVSIDDPDDGNQAFDANEDNPAEDRSTLSYDEPVEEAVSDENDQQAGDEETEQNNENLITIEIGDDNEANEEIDETNDDENEEFRTNDELLTIGLL